MSRDNNVNYAHWIKTSEHWLWEHTPHSLSIVTLDAWPWPRQWTSGLQGTSSGPLCGLRWDFVDRFVTCDLWMWMICCRCGGCWPSCLLVSSTASGSSSGTPSTSTRWMGQVYDNKKGIKLLYKFFKLQIWQHIRHLTTAQNGLVLSTSLVVSGSEPGVLCWLHAPHRLLDPRRLHLLCLPWRVRVSWSIPLIWNLKTWKSFLSVDHVEPGWVGCWRSGCTGTAAGRRPAPWALPSSCSWAWASSSGATSCCSPPPGASMTPPLSRWAVIGADSSTYWPLIGPALPPGHCLHPGHLVSGALVKRCPDSAVQGCTTPRMCRSTLSSAPSGVSSRTVSSPDPGTPTIWGRCSSTAPLQVMLVSQSSTVW